MALSDVVEPGSVSDEPQLADAPKFRDEPATSGDALESEIISSGHLESSSDGATNTIIAVVAFDLHPPMGSRWGKVVQRLPTSLTNMLSFTVTWQLLDNHRHVLHLTTRISSGAVRANLILLF